MLSMLSRTVFIAATIFLHVIPGSRALSGSPSADREPPPTRMQAVWV